MNIKAENLVKKYWAKTAVDGISLDIQPGQILGLLGPNGAGKSTTIKMLSGQLKPSGGKIVIEGNEFDHVPDAFRGRIGIMPQEIIVWDSLNIKENLEYTAALQRMSPAATRERTSFLIEALNLQKELKTYAKNLSGGYRRRLNLAISIIHDPEVIFLDEPTPGIDPQSRRLLWEFVKNLRDSEKYSIVLTDHYLDEAERMSDTVVIIDAGRIIALGTVQELKKKHMEENVIIVTFDDIIDEGRQSRLKSTAEKKFKNFKVFADSVIFYVEDSVKAIGDVVEILKSMQIEAKDISLKEPTLEDVFLKLTGKEIRE